MRVWGLVYRLDDRQMSRDEQRRHHVIVVHEGVEVAKTGENFPFSCIVGGLVP